MKVSDYIVDFLINKGIDQVFGFPGGMVMHLMQSFDRRRNEICAHLNYHEQGSAFCACGYSQIKNTVGMAYATSGPGATNLITGIANAYFDSVPCIFITGQVNTYESRGRLMVRQKGFQEMEVVKLMEPICKYAVKVDQPETIRYHLEKAYHICSTGRPGPVVLDIPMDVQRSEIDESKMEGFTDQGPTLSQTDSIIDQIYMAIARSKKPIIMAGNGINISGSRKVFSAMIEKLKIPVITSMISIDLLPSDSPYNFGFIGAYGHRYANYLASECDLIISVGSRMDTRQTGVNTDWFAPNAEIVRLDIDLEELGNRIKKNEIGLEADLRQLLPDLLQDQRFDFGSKYESWLNICIRVKEILENRDEEYANKLIRKFSALIPDDYNVTTDVGQNQVWVAQSFKVKKNQRVLFSGGHGAMGYSLPAAIGAYYASKKPVICFTGDGGLQMNLQELQFLARERIPVKIILLNNSSLGMMRHFQEMYFESNFFHTKAEKGYLPPDFGKIAAAFDINYKMISSEDELSTLWECIEDNNPQLINMILKSDTYLFPKLAINKPINDQEPPLDMDIRDRVDRIIKEID